MCWMCDDPTMTKGDALARMAGMVEEYGWAIQFVEGDRVHPPWGYTVGLTLRGCRSWWSPGCGRRRPAIC